MKIAVIGANGQLGHAIVSLAETQGHHVRALTRSDLDVSDLAAVDESLETLEVDALFNCTAYNLVDQAEKERDLANLINGLAPGRMARSAALTGARFVHFSTDYVFGEGHVDPIDESRTPEPLSAYGRSKRMGELSVLSANPDSLVIRTTGLYSGRRKNFVTSMLGYARDGRELTVVNDQWISPTWVQPLARVSLELLDAPHSGIVHAVSQGSCTWYDLAGRAFELAEIDANLKPISQADWAADARRPGYSVLDNGVLRTLGLDHHLVGWDEALATFFSAENP